LQHDVIDNEREKEERTTRNQWIIRIMNH